MTERENFFLAYHGEQPEWTPNFFSAYQPMGSSLLNNNGVMGKGGRDMFGANWLVTADTGYQAIPDPHEHLIEDITQWRDIIQFPDLDAMDWEAAAARDVGWFNREEKVLCVFGMEGNFNRLQSLMGICEAMVAMVEEPEAVYDFFKAYTEFKMKTIEKYAKYYKPDIYVTADDVCSSDGLFMSRSMYEELIKPFEIMQGQKALSEGMIVEHHVCGKADMLVDDMLDMGATIWQMGQAPMNDLVEVQKKYGKKIMIHGGWNSFAPHNYDNCTEEEVRAEVRRCIDTYRNNGFYALFPVVMGDMADERIQKRRFWVDDECHKYRPWL